MQGSPRGQELRVARKDLLDPRPGFLRVEDGWGAASDLVQDPDQAVPLEDGLEVPGEPLQLGVGVGGNVCRLVSCL